MTMPSEPAHLKACIRNLYANGRWLPLTPGGGGGGWRGFNIGDCDGSACGGELCRNGGQGRASGQGWKRNFEANIVG